MTLASPRDEAYRLEVEIADMVKELNHEAQSRAVRAVNVMRNSALDVLAQDGHGRKYKRGAKGWHTASAPGETPAPDTGNLRRNWRQYVLGRPWAKGVQITCRLKSDMPYASLLEEGTGRIAPRPFRQKIIDASMLEIETIYDGAGG